MKMFIVVYMEREFPFIWRLSLVNIGSVNDSSTKPLTDAMLSQVGVIFRYKASVKPSFLVPVDRVVF